MEHTYMIEGGHYVHPVPGRDDMSQSGVSEFFK